MLKAHFFDKDTEEVILHKSMKKVADQVTA